MFYYVVYLLAILFIIEIINYKEAYTIYMYDSSHNPILDASNSHIHNTELFPTLNNRKTTDLIQMFTDISYCDNLDDLSYSSLNNKYVLLDDLTFYNKYEGFSEIPYIIEQSYLWVIGILFIAILSLNNFR